MCTLKFRFSGENRLIRLKLKETKNHSKLSSLPHGVKGRYCALLNYNPNTLSETRPFFDIYESEGNHLQKHIKDVPDLDKALKDSAYMAFPRAIEFRPFNNQNLIHTIQELVSEEIEIGENSETWGGDNFCFVQADISERGTDMVRVAHDRFIFFKKSLVDIKNKLQKYKKVLEKSHHFGNIDLLISNSTAIEAILTNLQVTPDTSGAINEHGKTTKELGLEVRLRKEMTDQIQVPLSPVKTHCHLSGNAASEFIIENKLHIFVQDLLLVAQIFEYAALVRFVDKDHYGCFPNIRQTNGKGLTIKFYDFHHPFLLRHGQRQSETELFSREFFQGNVGEKAYNRLFQEGLLVEDFTLTDSFSQRKDTKARWAEGLKLQTLKETLSSIPGIHDQLIESICENFRAKCSEPFGELVLGEIDPETNEATTIVVLPSPNMAGKSTAMKAIALILHEGLMARKVSCSRAEMSIPDQIFHNFNVKDDISEQRSTFKAQLENVDDFLKNATIDSLGLFDELFNGTSSDYQLALAWAFLEECSQKKLRVIISTHNKELEYFSDPDGFNKIKGTHFRPEECVQPKGARNAKTLSIGPDRKLKFGSERDSEALVIAQEILGDSHPTLLSRAKELLDHIRGF